MAVGSNFAFKIAAKPLQIDIFTIDNLQELVIASSNGTIADPHDVP